MNRWEVQFGPQTMPWMVTAPTAADAIVIAASLERRTMVARFGRWSPMPNVDMQTPWGIRWISSANVQMGEPPAVKEPTPWKCNICGVMHGLSTVDDHRHEDDPRSTYYAGPKPGASE